MSEFWSHFIEVDGNEVEDDPGPKDEVIRVLLDSMAEGLYVINRLGECVVCNERCVSLLGYEHKSDLLGQNMHGLIHHQDRDGQPIKEQDCSIYRAFRRGDRIHVDEEVFWRKDGSCFDVEYSSFPLKQEGVVTGAVVTFLDISQRRATEANLRLRTRAIEEATNGIIITDATQPDNPIVYANATFSKMTGYLPEEVIGRNCRFLQGVETDQASVDRIRTAIEDGQECREVLRNYRKDGSSFWNELLVAPVRDQRGVVTAFIGIQSDVTDREETRLALEEARQRAEAASRAKSEFLAHVSHELRSPMTAILGFADLLQQGELDATGADYAETIRRNGKYLLRLINDILDMSKIESGRVSVESEDVDLSQLIEEVRSLMTARARERGLEFTVECTTPIPSAISTDSVRLRQVLVNLLTNAIKFTDRGGVHLMLACDQESEPPRLSMAVRDTGIGIPVEDQQVLFEPFVQVSSDPKHREGGTGLGLAISRRLAEALGGELTLKSRVGDGSTFTLSLPIASLPENALMIDEVSATIRPDEVDNSPAVRLTSRILVADDRRDIQHLLKHFLTGAGATVELVNNGSEAVDRLLGNSDDLEDGPPAIDLLMLDMQMPTMDGYEAASWLRAAGFDKPIIALTANAKASERQKCLESGCDDFLTKPLDVRKLLKTVSQWEQQTHHAAAP